MLDDSQLRSFDLKRGPRRKENVKDLLITRRYGPWTTEDRFSTANDCFACDAATQTGKSGGVKKSCRIM